MKEHIDPITKTEYPAYNTINTDDEPDTLEYEDCLFALKAQGINSDIVVNFINAFESGKVKLLTKIDQNQFDASGNYLTNDKVSHIQTDLFIEEVANLQLETLNGGKLSVKQNTKVIDKDRYSSMAYLLFYIFKYENNSIEEKKVDITQMLVFKQPKYR